MQDSVTRPENLELLWIWFNQKGHSHYRWPERSKFPSVIPSTTRDQRLLRPEQTMTVNRSNLTSPAINRIVWSNLLLRLHIIVVKTAGKQYLSLCVPHHIGSWYSFKMRFPGLIRKYKKCESLKRLYIANI